MVHASLVVLPYTLFALFTCLLSIHILYPTFFQGAQGDVYHSFPLIVIETTFWVGESKR